MPFNLGALEYLVVLIITFGTILFLLRNLVPTTPRHHPGESGRLQRLEHKLDLLGERFDVVDAEDQSGEFSALQRLERKLDSILFRLDIPYVEPPRTRWQELADEGRKIPAIKAYREEFGGSLYDAKKAVEEFLAE